MQMDFDKYRLKLKIRKKNCRVMSIEFRSLRRCEQIQEKKKKTTKKTKNNNTKIKKNKTKKQQQKKTKKRNKQIKELKVVGVIYLFIHDRSVILIIRYFLSAFSSVAIELIMTGKQYQANHARLNLVRVFRPILVRSN